MGRRMSSESGGDPSHVPVASIAFNPRNPRDTLEIDDEFVGSIEQVGVLQPITVIRYELYVFRYKEMEAEIGQASWVVVHGNRRLAGAQKAGLESVPVTVAATLAREDKIDESTLIENVHRKDLPPLREALLISELADKHGSKSAVAQALAKSNGWVSQRLSLLKLVPQLQQKLSTKELTVEAARELATLPQPQQLAAWEAGPPYKTKRSRKPAPRDGVDPADPTTYEHDVLAPSGETAKQLTPPKGTSTAETTARGPGATAPQPPGEFYAVKPDDELIQVLQLRTSSDVASAVRAAMPPEQVAEVALLLRNE